MTSTIQIERNGFVFDVEYLYQKAEPQTRDYPGDREGVEIENIFCNGKKITVSKNILNQFSNLILNYINES